MRNASGLLSLWHATRRRQRVWAAEIIFMLFVSCVAVLSSPPFFPLSSEINACGCVGCMCARVRARAQLHAMRGCSGSALMCSSLIIRTALRPIRHSDRRWKHSIDYVHFIRKPIPIWGEEKAVKQRWIQAANGSGPALSVDSSGFFFFSGSRFFFPFPFLNFSACQGLSGSKCGQ